MLARIIPLWKSFDRYGLSYYVDKKKCPDISQWDIILAPFGNWEILWVFAREDDVWKVWNTGKMKEILEVYPKDFSLDPEYIKIIDFISGYYFTLIHHAAWLYFPKNLREKLLKRSYARIKENEYTYKQSKVLLSEKQDEIYRQIISSQQKKFLLYGITGSWKTEIYTKIISQCIEKGKQVLLLIPEIILTSQIETRMKKHFWDDILVLHSWISAAKKTQYWYDIKTGNAKIIVGTRSSLFYPYKNLWAIIMDEEHDESFISDSVPRYHAKEIAEKLSELFDIPLILGSWTPKIISFYKALAWEYKVLQLLESYSD